MKELDKIRRADQKWKKKNDLSEFKRVHTHDLNLVEWDHRLAEKEAKREYNRKLRSLTFEKASLASRLNLEYDLKVLRYKRDYELKLNRGFDEEDAAFPQNEDDGPPGETPEIRIDTGVTSHLNTVESEDFGILVASVSCELRSAAQSDYKIAEKAAQEIQEILDRSKKSRIYRCYSRIIDV